MIRRRPVGGSVTLAVVVVSGVVSVASCTSSAVSPPPCDPRVQTAACSSDSDCAGLPCYCADGQQLLPDAGAVVNTCTRAANDLYTRCGVMTGQLPVTDDAHCTPRLACVAQCVLAQPCTGYMQCFTAPECQQLPDQPSDAGATSTGACVAGQCRTAAACTDACASHAGLAEACPPASDAGAPDATTGSDAPMRDGSGPPDGGGPTDVFVPLDGAISATCATFGMRGAPCCQGMTNCSTDPQTWAEWCQIYQNACAPLPACFMATDCATLLACVAPNLGCDGG